MAALLSSVNTSEVQLSDATPALSDLPWLVVLDRENLRLFLGEYATAYRSALDTGSSEELNDLLKEWEATAQALADPELRRLLAEERLPGTERVPLDYPI
jgi:hypothetical protein